MSEHPQMALAYGDTLLLCRVSSFIPSQLALTQRHQGHCSQVLPGEVERLDWPGHGMVEDISERHDSRELVRHNMGWIHVIKDEAQILPYCILHLTDKGDLDRSAGPLQGEQDHNTNSAVTPTGPSGQQLLVDSQAPREQQN